MQGLRRGSHDGEGNTRWEAGVALLTSANVRCTSTECWTRGLPLWDPGPRREKGRSGVGRNGMQIRPCALTLPAPAPPNPALSSSPTRVGAGICPASPPVAGPAGLSCLSAAAPTSMEQGLVRPGGRVLRVRAEGVSVHSAGPPGLAPTSRPWPASSGPRPLPVRLLLHRSAWGCLCLLCRSATFLPPDSGAVSPPGWASGTHFPAPLHCTQRTHSPGHPPGSRIET